MIEELNLSSFWLTVVFIVTLWLMYQIAKIPSKIDIEETVEDSKETVEDSKETVEDSKDTVEDSKDTVEPAYLSWHGAVIQGQGRSGYEQY